MEHKEMFDAGTTSVQVQSQIEGEHDDDEWRTVLYGRFEQDGTWYIDPSSVPYADSDEFIEFATESAREQDVVQLINKSYNKAYGASEAPDY